jgi:hypothetical protein
MPLLKKELTQMEIAIDHPTQKRSALYAHTFMAPCHRYRRATDLVCPG